MILGSFLKSGARKQSFDRFSQSISLLEKVQTENPPTVNKTKENQQDRGSQAMDAGHNQPPVPCRSLERRRHWCEGFWGEADLTFVFPFPPLSPGISPKWHI